MADPRRFSEIEAKKVEWLWKDRIPKSMISIVAGKPDQGKGLFAAYLAADVTKRGGNVLYSAMEDDAGLMTRPRLQAAGANLDRVMEWRFTLPTQFDELCNHVLDKKIDLVVIDPFAAHLKGVSRHSDNIRGVTSPLSELAEASGCSMLITEHALKRTSAKAHPLSAIGGSGSGLPAASRMAFVFGVDPEDAERRVLCCVKSNLRDQPKAFAFDTDTDELPLVGEVPALVPEGECEFDARRLLAQEEGNGKPGRNPDKRAAASEWLTTYLATAGKPVKAGEIIEDAKQYGLAAKTVRRAAEDMEVVKNPPGGGRNCTWDLPDAVKKAMGVGGDGS